MHELLRLVDLDLYCGTMMLLFDNLNEGHSKISKTSGGIKMLALLKREDSNGVKVETCGEPITKVDLLMVCSSFLYN